ncbi:MAG: reverse transcriptase-like protein [Chitinophagaceae bacterium]|nr:reverse transcriptase-like protein [Chitinophagaceae bacterium]
MTSFEAEYAALVLGLTTVKRFNPAAVHVFMDSQGVIDQMTGQRRVISQGLKVWHNQACHLAHQFKKITFTHIPRDFNQLADALAGEAWAEAEKGNNGTGTSS